ncbi:sigma-54-dependent Fis family transcriptional regulator [Brevibacillus laterosporus]|uniref:sigma-54 interaction domain-containing protein n=1 Tax=Brevibacillus laterosporus TaxID=1465 RepID=UPI000CE51236|nr:sigma 54-interacting transcriptional regulator [Brevibacillus laterosporus]PPA82260.1 sigma-54-dependent Fis family transcriptional regulator [Brevibacillus laterosporus]
MKSFFSLQMKVTAFMLPLSNSELFPSQAGFTGNVMHSYLPEYCAIPGSHTLWQAFLCVSSFLSQSEISAFHTKLLVLDSPDGQPIGYLPFEQLFETIGTVANNQEALLHTLLATMSEATTIVDSSNQVVYWNPAAEKLYQIKKEDVVGTPLDNHFASESIRLKIALSEGSAVQRLYHIPRPNQHVLINSAPITQSSEIIGAISIEQDITELVKLHEELTNTTEHLHNLQQEMTRYQASTDPFFPIKGHSPALQTAMQTARKVAVTDATVLIYGESGVGKELFAQAIHQVSKRSKKSFVAINCAAIPAALFESELFGYQGGAFTGAERKGKPGKIELAHEGTLFLDEIGELPLELQAKLLRALQERQFYRVGGTEPIYVNTRIIAATNKNLERMVAEGRFREDLYYRLNVFSLELPSLRERLEDILELVPIFLHEYSLANDHAVPRIMPDVMQALLDYHWPGNIRQLRNIIERLSILQENGVITWEHLPAALKTAHERNSDNQTHSGSLSSTELSSTYIVSTVSPSNGNQTRSDTYGVHNEYVPARFGREGDKEKTKILQALERTYGNKKAAAQLLGMSRGTLYNKMKRYGLVEESSKR